MSPDIQQVHLPPQCVLDKDRLAKIERSVESIEKKIDKFFSYDGPISSINERLSITEGKAVHAHTRIDDLEDDVDEQTTITGKLALKIAGWTAALSSTGTGAIVLALLKLLE